MKVDASYSDSNASNDEDEWGSNDDGCRLLVGDWLRVIGLDAMGVRNATSVFQQRLHECC